MPGAPLGPQACCVLLAHGQRPAGARVRLGGVCLLGLVFCVLLWLA